MSGNKGFFHKIWDWFSERFESEKFLKFFSAAFVYGALDERLPFKEALEKALKRPIPKFVNGWFCFGGIAFFLFVVQVITGILLAFYYKASPEDAYESIKFIINEVPMGWLIREIHVWTAHLLILAVIIHTARVFFHKAYRPPRELNWIVGVLLLFITLGFGFTGALLSWDSIAYGATVQGTEMLGKLPLLGHAAMILIRGGPNVTGATLTRFFAVHALVLPWFITYLLIAHFIMIRKQGISQPL